MLPLENFETAWKRFVANLSNHLRELRVERLGINLITELTDQKMQFFTTFEEGTNTAVQMGKLHHYIKEEIWEGSDDFLLVTEDLLLEVYDLDADYIFVEPVPTLEVAKQIIAETDAEFAYLREME